MRSNKITVSLYALLTIAMSFGGNAIAATTPGNSVPPPPKQIADTSEPLVGTLFFSREQRERIDRARKQGAIVLEEDDVVVIKTRASTINGFVKRSDGKTTVWVDGQRLNDVPGTSEDVHPTDVGSGDSQKRVHLTSILAEPQNSIHTPKKMHAKPVRKARAMVVPKTKKI